LISTVVEHVAVLFEASVTVQVIVFIPIGNVPLASLPVPERTTVFDELRTTYVITDPLQLSVAVSAGIVYTLLSLT
jgi:hypothetical protein